MNLKKYFILFFVILFSNLCFANIEDNLFFEIKKLVYKNYNYYIVKNTKIIKRKNNIFEDNIHNFKFLGIDEIINSLICNKKNYIIREYFNCLGNSLDIQYYLNERIKINEYNIYFKLINLIEVLPCNSIYSHNLIKIFINAGGITTNKFLNDSFSKISWTVSHGSNVIILYYGNGFKLINRGKVINNAMIGDCVKVLLPSGKLITGILKKDNLVLKKNCLVY